MANLLDKKILVDPDDLVIKPELEFHNLMRDGDDDGLENQILSEGRIRDSISVWVHEGQLILTDGFRRRRIVKKHKMKILFEANQWEFESIEEVMDWIEDNQQNRRNLTDDQQAYFEGQQYNKLNHNKARLARFLKMKNRLELLPADLNEIHTAQILGTIYKKDEKTIRRNGQFARGIEIIRERNPVLAEKILRQGSIVEFGKEVKATKALIIKFGELTPPKEIGSLLDIQEAVDSNPKKSHDKYETEKEEVILLVEKFLEKCTLPLKQAVDTKINEYFGRHGQKEKPKMVA